MLIYEVVCRDFYSNYVLFRTKDSVKAETFCDVYNKYHAAVFDRSAIVNVIDTSKIEKLADETINQFKFMTEVKIDKESGEVLSRKPVFVDDKRIAAAQLSSPLSQVLTLFFDITSDFSDSLLKAKAVAELEENYSDSADIVGVNC